MKMLSKYPWIIDFQDENEWIVIDATPIVHSSYESFVKGDIENLPVMPPWSSFFVEFTPHIGARQRYGLKCECNEVGHGVVLLTCEVWTNVFKLEPVKVGVFQVVVDRNKGCQKFKILGKVDINPKDIKGRTVEGYIFTCFKMLLGILAFCNCKNVEIIDCNKTINKVKKKKKRKQKKGIKYSQIVIDRKPLRCASGGGSCDGKNLIHHVVRGHFSDYREKGLFGKEVLKGIFWVPMHARGSKNYGEVVKSYQVGR